MMIGRWDTHYRAFLWAIGVVVIMSFGLPMTIFPLQWAQTLGWEVAANDELAIYYGRCLGSVITILCVFSIIAARSITTARFFMRLMMGNFTAMILVHIYGALMEIQPLAETLEIGMWAGLICVVLLFYPREVAVATSTEHPYEERAFVAE